MAFIDLRRTDNSASEEADSEQDEKHAHQRQSNHLQNAKQPHRARNQERQRPLPRPRATQQELIQESGHERSATKPD